MVSLMGKRCYYVIAFDHWQLKCLEAKFIDNYYLMGKREGNEEEEKVIDNCHRAPH